MRTLKQTTTSKVAGSASSSSTMNTRQPPSSTSTRSGSVNQQPGTTTLHDLPIEVLEQICRHALVRGHSRPATLLTVNSAWQRATAATLYRSLTLPDNDALLLLAEPGRDVNEGEDDHDHDHDANPSSSTFEPKLVSRLKAIYRSTVYSNSVRSLQIVESVSLENECEHDKNDCDAINRTSPLQCKGRSSSLSSPAHQTATETEQARVNTACIPLNSRALYELIHDHLSTSLRSLQWHAARPPPASVVQALAACRHFTSFTAWSASQVQQLLPPHSTTPPPPLHLRSPSSAALAARSETTSIRWDATCLSFLPLGQMTQLRLQNLSSEGVRTFYNALPSIPACEVLVLEDTLFIDDAFFAALADHCARLRILSILSMGGTKLTNRGIAALLERSSALELLELHDFQGRLTKRCWSEIEIAPTSFKSLKVSFSESSKAHHSWTVDHLQSLAHLISNAGSLTDLSVTRVVPPETCQPFQHETAPVASVMEATPVPDNLLQALLKHRHSLRTLDLDFWSISPDQMKGLLDSVTGLLRCSMLLDAPFSKVLAISSTFMGMHALQVLSLKLPVAHTPSLQSMNSLFTPLANLGSPPKGHCALPPLPPLDGNEDQGPGTAPLSPTRPRSNTFAQVSALPTSFGASSALPKDVIPALRDIKKLVKRCPTLTRLEWLGRGGVGVWRVRKGGNGTTSSSREGGVSFVPVTDYPVELLTKDTRIDVFREVDRMHATDADLVRDLVLPMGLVRTRKVDVGEDGDGIAFDTASQPHGDNSPARTVSDDASSPLLAKVSSRDTAATSPGCFAVTKSVGKEDPPQTPIRTVNVGVSEYPYQTVSEDSVAPTGIPLLSRHLSDMALSSARNGREKTTSPQSPSPPARNGAQSGTSQIKSKAAASKEPSTPPERVKIIHGGGWTSKKVKTKSSNSQTKSPKTPSDSGPSKQVPLTAENLKTIPSTNSLADFPDLVGRGKEEKQTTKSGNGNRNKPVAQKTKNGKQRK